AGFINRNQGNAPSENCVPATPKHAVFPYPLSLLTDEAVQRRLRFTGEPGLGSAGGEPFEHLLSGRRADVFQHGHSSQGAQQLRPRDWPTQTLQDVLDTPSYFQSRLLL